MSIRVAVVGAAGRMGRTVCEAVGAAEDMELVAELDAGDAITRESLGGAEVAVEFSVPAAAEANALAILDSGADAVVGVDLDYEVLGQGDMLMVSMTGTAVALSYRG